MALFSFLPSIYKSTLQPGNITASETYASASVASASLESPSSDPGLSWSQGWLKRAASSQGPAQTALQGSVLIHTKATFHSLYFSCISDLDEGLTSVLRSAKRQ